MRFFILIIVLLFGTSSCYKPGKIEIANHIDNAELIDITWGDLNLASSLLPGESSGEIKILKSEEKLPSTYTVSFKMRSNNQIIFLTTIESFELDEDELLTIILDDNTKVTNNN